MPFVTRTNAKRQRSPTDAKKIFIGRTNEMHFFMENILEPDIPTHNILSISGQGGVGKSTLLAQFANVAHTANFQDYCLIAQVDERQITAASAIEKLAKELHITGEFEKALGSYKESLRKLRYKQGKTHVAVASDAGAGLASSMVKMLVPIPVVNEVTGKGAETLTKLTFKQIYFRQRLKDAERLEDPMGALTATFVKELNRLADKQATLRTDQTKRRTRVLLFFDSFEQLASEVVSWILDYFLEAEISQNVVLVTAGRNPIERSFPGDPKRWLPYINGGIIHSMLLDNFNEDQTRKYLTRRNITDNAQIDKIWELSRGLPLYLTFLTADIQETIDVTAGVVANFLRWIPEQEQTKRQLVLDASLLSRPFNQDELALFTYLSEDERSSLYRWLSEQPFVKSSVSDGRYSYHELAQELFNRHLYQSAPDACSATRRVIAAYYQSHLNKVQEDGNEENSISAERLELLLALLSQLFQLPDSIGYIQAIEQVLNIYDQGAQMGGITKLLREISNKQSNGEVSAKAIQIITLVLQYLEPGTGNREILEATSNLLEIVADEASFPKELLAHIYNNRGISYNNLSQYRQAISDFTRSIELSPEDAVLSINRGDTYTYLEEYQQAIADKPSPIIAALSNLSQKRESSMPTEPTPTSRCRTTSKPSPTAAAPSSLPRQRRHFMQIGPVPMPCCRTTSKPSPTSPAPSSLTRTMQTTTTSELMSTMSQGSASRLFPTLAAPSSLTRQRRSFTTTEAIPTPRCRTTSRPSPTSPAPSSLTRQRRSSSTTEPTPTLCCRTTSKP